MVLITASGMILILVIAMMYRRRHVNVNRPARLVTRAIWWRAKRVRAANDNMRQSVVYKVEHRRPRRS